MEQFYFLKDGQKCDSFLVADFGMCWKIGRFFKCHFIVILFQFLFLPVPDVFPIPVLVDFFFAGGVLPFRAASNLFRIPLA